MRMLAVAIAALAMFVLAMPARADLLIQIDKSTQQMRVSADGETLYTWPVSTGIARYDTPNGAYTPFRKEKEHFSEEWDNAPMPYSIFFTMKGHAIHGTNHKGLGHAASHGCVRLSVANAATLWGLVAKHKMAHTTVELTGTIPAGDEPAVARAEPPNGAKAAPRADDPTQFYDDDDEVVVARPPQRIYREPPRGYYYDDRPRGVFPFLFGR
jgi:hypothetical protein